jgi:hypothetical protein
VKPTSAITIIPKTDGFLEYLGPDVGSLIEDLLENFGGLDEMLSWLGKARPTTVEVVILKQELEDWLTNHISTLDVKLRGCK